MTAALHSTVDGDRHERSLETTAFFACGWYHADYLLIDRVTDLEHVHVHAVLDDGHVVDLWELDPILWADAADAATTTVAPGTARIVRPRLHR